MIKQDILSYLWTFIIGASQYKSVASNLINEALIILKDLICFKLKSEKINFINKCIQSISKNVSVHQCLEV